MTELALDTELTAEQREYLEIVKSSSDALLKVINDILDFSKIEAGKLIIENIAFNLDQMVGETLKSLALRAQGKGLELVCDVDADLPLAVVGDPGRLRQVLMNLIGNAIKFTEQGAVVMEVALVSLNDKTVKLQFDVRDSGIGIELARQKSIFEPFWQKVGHAAHRAHSTRGTGLGLSVARALVELMEGQIWLSSRPGQGSTFSFTVKLGVPESSLSLIHI